jgi:hypothetical protein
VKSLKKFGSLIFTIALSSVLSLAVIGYSQNQLTEVYDLIFRVQNPQIRVVGTARVLDHLGTSTAALAMARPTIVTTAATRTLTVSECGAVIVGNATSSTQVFTLPAAAQSGCLFTFIAGHADTEIQFKSAAVATCVFTHFAAVGADADTAIVTDTSCEGGIKNTAATNAIGDSITIVSDGTRWLGVGIASGIWAVV